MPRMIEIKTGNNLTIAGPARVIVYGKPTLSGTQPVPAADTQSSEETIRSTPHDKPAHATA
jgi:hypothetical protein